MPPLTLSLRPPSGCYPALPLTLPPSSPLEDHPMSTLPLLLTAAVTAAIVAATPALADGARAPFDGMTEQAISQIVAYAGYDVGDRKSVVEGKSVSVCLYIGGGVIIIKQIK